MLCAALNWGCTVPPLVSILAYHSMLTAYWKQHGHLERCHQSQWVCKFSQSLGPVLCMPGYASWHSTLQGCEPCHLCKSMVLWWWRCCCACSLAAGSGVNPLVPASCWTARAVLHAYGLAKPSAAAGSAGLLLRHASHDVPITF